MTFSSKLVLTANGSFVRAIRTVNNTVAFECRVNALNAITARPCVCWTVECNCLINSKPKKYNTNIDSWPNSQTGHEFIFF